MPKSNQSVNMTFFLLLRQFDIVIMQILQVLRLIRQSWQTCVHSRRNSKISNKLGVEKITLNNFALLKNNHNMLAMFLYNQNAC